VDQLVGERIIAWFGGINRGSVTRQLSSWCFFFRRFYGWLNFLCNVVRFYGWWWLYGCAMSPWKRCPLKKARHCPMHVLPCAIAMCHSRCAMSRCHDFPCLCVEDVGSPNGPNALVCHHICCKPRLPSGSIPRRTIRSLVHWIIGFGGKIHRFGPCFFSVKQRVAPQEIDDTIIYNYHCPYWNIEMAIWEGLKLLSLPLHWREHILGGFIGRKIMKNLDMFGASN
jgi:hypothetical protein